MRRLAWLLPVVLLLPSTPSLQAQPLPPAYDAWYRAIRDPEPEENRGLAIQDLTLRRDAAAFHLASGVVRILPEVDGRRWAAVFVGRGRLTFEAPDPVERDRIRAEYESESLDVPFRRAVFYFTDLTGSELAEAGTPAGIEALEDSWDDAEDELKEARDYVTDGDGWVRRSLLVPLLNGGPGFFYAHVSEDEDEPFFITVDPYSAEEVTLARRGDGRKGVRRTVASFHREADYSSGRSLPQEALDLIRVTGYEIETEVESGLDLRGRTTASVVPQATNHPWVPFHLHPDLKVDSARWADGTPVSWARADDRSDVWFDLSAMPAGGGHLTVSYHGDVMDQYLDFWVEMKTFNTWFPVHAFDRPVPYRMTFLTPDDYSVATVGTRVEEAVDDGTRRSVWETPPVRLVAFNLGEFEAHEIEEPGAPPITVQLSERAHSQLQGMTWDYGVYIPEQEDMADAVARDLVRAFLFCQEVFGPPPVERFLATEIPYGHGEAYPGLVLLSWSTFQQTSQKGFDEMFRAHEVAHQWWGIGVRPATDRDRWLAEGFSEFAGLWYAARVRGSVGMYMERLATTRDDLLERRGEAAPISLGSRVANRRHPEDYSLVVYSKGAWVLHMLRTLLTDPDTGNDEVFTGMIRSFYQDNLGKAVTTAHFQAAVEAAVGADMTWFFDQWVHGTHIPTYRFAHRYEDQPDGSVKAFVRIRQEEVPEDFRMIVPILLDFGADGTAVVRVDVNGPVTEAALPLLPRRPDRIQLNPQEAVLAEVKTEDWR